jgi:para-nitrobenzyl esterase
MAVITRRSLLKAAATGLAGAALPWQQRAFGQASTSTQIVFSDASAVVDTASGRIRGYIDRDIYVFKGVPYGTPPIGRLRFMAPEKPRPWTNIRNSLQYGAACPQPGGRFDDLKT